MTHQINSNVDANLARQDNIDYSSFNRREGENPNHTNFLNNAYRSSEVVNTNYHNISSFTGNLYAPNNHNNASNNNHNNASSTTTKDAVVYHYYTLGNRTFMHPTTEPEYFEGAVRCIFYKRSDITLDEQMLMLTQNQDAILSNVKDVVHYSLYGMTPFMRRKYIDLHMWVLNNVYALNATHMDGSIFTILYDEISSFLCDIHSVYFDEDE